NSNPRAWTHVIFCLVLCFSTGSSVSDKVQQTPADIHKKQGQTAKIYCSHNDNNYNQILWYKKSDRELQFLGYMLTISGKPADGVNVKIEGGASKGQNCTLTIEGLSLNNSAVYFCAASYHSATHHCFSVQKPHCHIFNQFTAPYTCAPSSH
uniref:Ig-like domain-containing protein n=1 Tax=Lates calcarifer TaxID=8187 RepID=A0A4W6BUR6_LATCA